MTKEGKFVFDIPHKSAPFVPSRAGASKHETYSRMVLRLRNMQIYICRIHVRNMQKWTFSRKVLGHVRLGTCKIS